MKEGLSKSKLVFVEKIVQHLDAVNELKLNFDENKFMKQFGKLGPVLGSPCCMSSVPKNIRYMISMFTGPITLLTEQIGRWQKG